MKMPEELQQAMRNGGCSPAVMEEIWNTHHEKIEELHGSYLVAGMGDYDAWKCSYMECMTMDAKKEEEVKIPRANKVTVQTVDGAPRARFWKTHKLLKEVDIAQAIELGYTTDTTLNAVAQRELFRAWICKNSSLIGIDYDPADKRATNNRFPSKYTSDTLLRGWSVKIVEDDVREWIKKVGEEYGVELVMSDIVADPIEEVTNRNGREVSPKYNNGNWAYAKVPVVTTVNYEGNEGYVTLTVELVSGQLKKPKTINDGKYNYTGFKQELLIDMKEFLPEIKKDEKEDKETAKIEAKEAQEEMAVALEMDVKTAQKGDVIGRYKDGTPKIKGFTKNGDPIKR